MIIGRNKKRISHNLIISSYFSEESSEISKQYYIRNVADELGVISLGFGGFFVFINPCSFSIEYNSNTFYELNDLNLVEVEKFESKAATVFRIENQEEIPKLNFEYIENQLLSKDNVEEFKSWVDKIDGANAQHTQVDAKLVTSVDSIKLDIDAIQKADYKHIENSRYSALVGNEKKAELDSEIAKKQRELEELKHQIINNEDVKAQISAYETYDISEFEKAFDELASEIISKDDCVKPDDLFAELDNVFETVDEDDNV